MTFIRQHIFLFIPLTLFLLIKLSKLDIRLSDSNIYFYTAIKLLEGNLLYKDIFFTNFPLLPYVSTVYYFLTFGNLSLYYLTATSEVMATSLLLYVLAYKATNHKFISFLTLLIYLFSFMILSTSDHQTGVFLASLLSVCAYYLFQQKRFFLTGIFLSLMILTKAYFLPIICAFLLTLFIKKQYKAILHVFVGGLLSSSIILLPTLLFAQKEFVQNVFIYSLTRGAGTDKAEIGWFFLTHDFLFLIVLLWNIINIRRQLFFGFVSLFSLIFFFLYQDVYYLYLNFSLPFLCLSFSTFYLTLEEKFCLQKLFLPTLLLVFLCVNIFLYVSFYQGLGTIGDMEKLVQKIESEKPAVLYGVNDITPALAYLTNTKLLDNVIDTNTNIFRKKILNNTMLSKKALEHKTMLVSHGAYYPEVGIDEKMVDEIFDKNMLEKKCRVIAHTPVQAEGFINRIYLHACY